MPALKRRVSAVQLRPWPPSNQQLQHSSSRPAGLMWRVRMLLSRTAPHPSRRPSSARSRSGAAYLWPAAGGTPGAAMKTQRPVCAFVAGNQPVIHQATLRRTDECQSGSLFSRDWLVGTYEYSGTISLILARTSSASSKNNAASKCLKRLSQSCTGPRALLILGNDVSSTPSLS